MKKTLLIGIPVIAIIILGLYLIIPTNSSTTAAKDEEGSQQQLDNTVSNKTRTDYNISILLDLSDRVIEPPMNPSQKVRDLEIISSVIDVFRGNMKKKGAYLAKDKMRIIFSPPPSDPNVNNIASRLSVDLSKLDNASKKEVYDNVEKDFEDGLEEIYDLTIDNSKWLGSDIWRFFKYDIDLCIEQDPSYKNILIIVTDGYLYHKQSELVKDPKHPNQTAFITPKYLERKEFWNNPNWKEKFESEDFGLISHDRNFDNLDVLVLEINPSPNHRDDQDIIRAYLVKWFEEMGITSPSLAIYDTDLPVNTKRRIELFFK
jgi:hypothetical protein